jgi:hypothetical protein
MAKETKSALVIHCMSLINEANKAFENQFQKKTNIRHGAISGQIFEFKHTADTLGNDAEEYHRKNMDKSIIVLRDKGYISHDEWGRYLLSEKPEFYPKYQLPPIKPVKKTPIEVKATGNLTIDEYKRYYELHDKLMGKCSFVQIEISDEWIEFQNLGRKVFK